MTAWAGPFKKFMNPKRKKYSNKSAKAEVREKKIRSTDLEFI
jgi:hypothetical protein